MDNKNIVINYTIGCVKSIISDKQKNIGRLQTRSKALERSGSIFFDSFKYLIDLEQEILTIYRDKLFELEERKANNKDLG